MSTHSDSNCIRSHKNSIIIFNALYFFIKTYRMKFSKNFVKIRHMHRANYACSELNGRSLGIRSNRVLLYSSTCIIKCGFY